MKHIKYPLGHLAAGSVVRFDLTGNAANVMVLDESNYSAYRSNRPFTFYGGGATSSPARVAVPRAATWIGVVDLGGTRGSVNASVSVEGNRR